MPRISAFANTQNKIQMADFSANDPFHRCMEELSRTIWTHIQHRLGLHYRVGQRKRIIFNHGNEVLFLKSEQLLVSKLRYKQANQAIKAYRKAAEKGFLV